MKTFLSVLVGLPVVLGGVNKGNVGKLPALGWNSWNAYGCNITEEKFMSAAQKIVDLGLKVIVLTSSSYTTVLTILPTAGYEYVNIDDCWSVRGPGGRDNTTGRIVVDTTKFPSGIDGLARKVHALGLKIGIYSSAGTHTCAGYPASLGKEDIDAKTWAEWGIDYLKYDNCNYPRIQADECKYCQELNITTRPCDRGFCPTGFDFSKTKTVERFNRMRDALDRVERPMVFSLCQWGEANVATWGNGTGQSWRTTTDITPTWRIVRYIANRNTFTLYSTNFWGHSDADMLEVGNGGLTPAEERTHFALWAGMKSPLLMGTDLAKLTQGSVEILKNSFLLAFNQDNSTGEPAVPYKWGTNPDWTFNDTHPAEYWSGGSRMGTFVFLVNVHDGVETKRLDFGAVPQLKGKGSVWQLFDVWSGLDKGCFDSGVDVEVAPHDTAVFVVTGSCADGTEVFKGGKLMQPDRDSIVVPIPPATVGGGRDGEENSGQD
ncbi:putative alpha-galactosidase B [Microthyrium microscopicum]|uniref:Alpha-galactosidase n=1 Tax=Microthyrium microscopicum TaxID=703497 RepID=A0A6A6UFS4_9PEZI|nr:putative alpha-galactosidase B [Microthyrium microscopicum]